MMIIYLLYVSQMAPRRSQKKLEEEADPLAQRHSSDQGDDVQDITRRILYRAHKDVKSRTKYLTELYQNYNQKTLNLGKRIKVSHEGKSSKPLYGPNDVIRLNESDHSKQNTVKSSIQGVTSFAKDYARIIHSPAFRRLQGKSQLIPAGESEFFRTRLTHSLEVAEIATRIARQINATHSYFKKYPLNLDLINCAGLLHDIGHPPFGHCGEEVLNEKMHNHGGFEGNAQTLRIITTLENRLGQDTEVSTAYGSPRGLNLTARTIASVIKYDKECEITDGTHVSKGYYVEEKDVVSKVKKILKMPEHKRLYTIECQIMDIADDIAYSAYDLEDTMEASIVTPLDAMAIEDESLKKMTEHANKQLKKYEFDSLEPADVLYVMQHVFGGIIIPAAENDYELTMRRRLDCVAYFGRSYLESAMHAKNSLIRRQFLETIIQSNINAISVDVDEEYPMLSTLKVHKNRLITIECMKAFNFHKVIYSKQLQYPQHRNKEIIEYLFKVFHKVESHRLLSEDEKRYWNHRNTDGEQTDKVWKRFICDKIASLTDKDAVQLFNKLNPAGEQSFFGYL